MPKLVTTRITPCPKCGENLWWLWLVKPDESGEPDTEKAAARTVDELRYYRRFHGMGPLGYVLWKFGRKRDSGVPTSADVARCKACGFERTFSLSGIEGDDDQTRTIAT